MLDLPIRLAGRGLFGVLIAVLAAILAVNMQSAQAVATAETRVGASSVVVEPFVGPPERIGAGQRLGNDGPRVVVVVATGVAANSSPRPIRGGARESVTVFHGTDIGSAQRFLGGGGLDEAAAAARKIDGPPGFFGATDLDDAIFFAGRRSPSTVLQFDLAPSAFDDLMHAGMRIRPIPQGAAPFPFRGNEFHVPSEAFSVFNRHLQGGGIRVGPARF